MTTCEDDGKSFWGHHDKPTLNVLGTRVIVYRQADGSFDMPLPAWGFTDESNAGTSSMRFIGKQVELPKSS